MSFWAPQPSIETQQHWSDFCPIPIDIQSHPNWVLVWINTPKTCHFQTTNSPLQFRYCCWTKFRLTTLICIKPYERWDLLSIDWCRISSINNMTGCLGNQISQKKNRVIGGIIILPTQTMHYYKGNPSKVPYICIVWFPPNRYFLMTPGEWHTSNAQQLAPIRQLAIRISCDFGRVTG